MGIFIQKSSLLGLEWLQNNCGVIDEEFGTRGNFIFLKHVYIMAGIIQ